jgi:hypothetical protein
MALLPPPSSSSRSGKLAAGARVVESKSLRVPSNEEERKASESKG